MRTSVRVAPQLLIQATAASIPSAAAMSRPKMGPIDVERLLCSDTTTFRVALVVVVGGTRKPRRWDRGASRSHAARVNGPHSRAQRTRL